MLFTSSLSLHVLQQIQRCSYMLLFNFCCWDKIPWETAIQGRKRFISVHSSRSSFVIVKRSRLELQTDGHTPSTFTSREKWMRACSLAFLLVLSSASLLLLHDPLPWEFCCHPHWGESFPHQLTWLRQPWTNKSVGQPNVGNPPLRLSFQRSLRCIKLEKKMKLTATLCKFPMNFAPWSLVFLGNNG